MEFKVSPAPFVAAPLHVGAMMREVLYALIPAAIAHVWFFGPGLIFNIVVSASFCLAGEALMLRVRQRPVRRGLRDYSALVTAVLLAFALPPLTPWWVTATGALFAIVVAKHLYGGLGFNVFNPAMAGYVVLLIAFPLPMNLWTAPRIGDLDYHYMTILETARYTLTGGLPDYLTIDAITQATPLDAVKTGFNNMRMFTEMRSSPLFGDFGGRGWEWINNFIAFGGLWLLYRGIIRWQIPVAVLFGIMVPTTIFYLLQPDTHASPAFHLYTGATLLCAFFIATDPVSAATSPRGRLVYGVGIGFLIYAIRRWGNYADGVSFAVLIMNMAAPAIDHFTRPRIVGHASSGRPLGEEP